VGAGEWRRRRREAAPVVDGVLVEAGKPTGGASTGWRWSMLVERLEVLGRGRPEAWGFRSSGETSPGIFNIVPL